MTEVRMRPELLSRGHISKDPTISRHSSPEATIDLLLRDSRVSREITIASLSPLVRRMTVLLIPTDKDPLRIIRTSREQDPTTAADLIRMKDSRMLPERSSSPSLSFALRL